MIACAARDARGSGFTVCTISFQGPEEVAEFRANLSPANFEMVALAPSRPAEGETGGRSWLMQTCRREQRCDVLVMSGEFGGRYFGAAPFSLGLQELEEASCDPACDGLFRDPVEVFLLACNTLATKDQDSRTPGDYLRVLLDHGFDQAMAERVVQIRYGPVGPSFRESTRRIFSGVPRIYGFSSVAPRGATTAPMLDRYFASVGDYAAYLARTGRSSAPNTRLRTAFAGTSLVQATGLQAGESGSSDRALVCELYDEGRSVDARLRTAAAIMARDDFLRFLPTMQVFLGRHPSKTFTPGEAAVFATMRDRSSARDDVLRLAHELDVSALKLEVAHFAAEMGWITAGEFRALARSGARELLAQPLTSEHVDIECEIAKHERVGDVIRSEDLSSQLFVNAEGLRMVDCLAPADPRVTPRLAAALDDADPSTRAWAVHALSRRLPLDEKTLLRLAAHLGDQSVEVRERVRWIMTTERRLPLSVVVAVRRHDPELGRRLK